MNETAQGLVKIGESDKTLFMLLLQQKALTFNLILRWLAPDCLALPAGKRPNLYFRLNRLLKAGYLKKQRIERLDVYILAQTGWEEVRDLNSRKIPLVTVAELDTIRHDLLAAELRLYLESNGATDWVSDREFKLHADKIPFFPDGACTVQGRTVFLEIELSQKAKARYDKIAEVYTAEKGPDRVLYIYQDDDVIEYLKGLVLKHTKIGFFKFDASFGPPAAVMGVSGSDETSLESFLCLP